MDARSTIRKSLLIYPELFKNKWSVCHHLFVVIGNGFKWVDGELVCDDLNENINTIEDAIDYKLKSFRQLYIDYFKKYNEVPKKLYNRIQSNIDDIINIDDRYNDFTQSEEFYSLSEYSKIMKLPDYIKDDWKMVLNEFYDFLIQNESKFSDLDKHFISTIEIDKFKM